MALLGLFLYLTMLPIIVLTSRHKGSFLVGVIVAFVYGFIGMFANGTLQSIYPVSAALGLINYRAGAEGVMWNKGLCFISILIMCVTDIAPHGAMNYKYTLVAYDESGNAKDVTFETSKVLTDGAYLCLKVAPIRGVVTWAEMQFDELPSSVQEKYKE